VAAPSAADIGTATHLALRLLDFRDAADEAAISRQIEQMVARRQLAPAIVAYIDLGSLAWLAGTELGGLLAAEHDRLLRELPVRVPADAAELVADWQGTADGPLDRVLLRGQVDVVIPRSDGLIMADYKTDRQPAGDAVGAQAWVDELVERYRRQLGHYDRALVQITGRPVILSYLILLHPRRLERVAGMVSV
jgi:ATP-dependent helicase/nuclease subunit A